MIVVQILLYILLFILTVLLIILAMPIYYAASGIKKDTVLLKAEVFGPLKWLHLIFKMQDINEREMQLRIFGIGINIKGRKVSSEDKDKVKQKLKKEMKERKEKGRKKKKRQKGLMQKIFKAIDGFWKHTRPMRIEAEGYYGFEDPYYTGLACALINCTSPHGDKYNINLTPVFDEEVIEGSFIVEGRIVPAVLLWILARVFIISELKARMPFTNKHKAQKTGLSRP